MVNPLFVSLYDIQQFPQDCFVQIINNRDESDNDEKDEEEEEEEEEEEDEDVLESEEFVLVTLKDHKTRFKLPSVLILSHQLNRKRMLNQYPASSRLSK